MGWRARFECAYPRRGRRGCSGRRLELHLLMLHSARRRARLEKPPLTHLQLERDELSTNGLHSGRANRKLSATMEPDLGGRTARDLQPRHQALSETYREEFSDSGHLGLDPVRRV
jgi:plasmid maintenance system killer protein